MKGYYIASIIEASSVNIYSEMSERIELGVQGKYTITLTVRTIVGPNISCKQKICHGEVLKVFSENHLVEMQPYPSIWHSE